MVMSLALISALQGKKKSPRAIRIGRGRKRRRGEDLVAPEIPLDLLIEILARLPAKSVMRFKCVSKLWFSLICSRYFCNRYLTVASPPRPHRMYMSLAEVTYDPFETVLVLLSPSSTSCVESFDQDLTIPGMGGLNMVIVRGLMLYIVVCNKACIYNPTTRQSVTLPAVKSNIFDQEEFRKTFLYFFGHDPVLDQYKIVCTVCISSKNLERITSEHWVFVQEAGGFWKRIEFDQPHMPARRGLCIDGVIYYLASTCMSRDILVSFDVGSEKFNMIRAPHHLVSLFCSSVGIIDYGGKPAVLDYSQVRESGLVDLWVLEDGGKWWRKSLVLQPCQIQLLGKDTGFTVEGTTQNGEVILAPTKLLFPFYIIYYDLQKNDLWKIHIRGIPDHWFSKPKLYSDVLFYFKLMDKEENIMHLEA